MPAKRMDQWNEYLDEVAALWDEIGADFKVGELTRAQFETLHTEWKSLQTRVAQIEAQLGVVIDERQGKIRIMEDFGVRFRSAVVTKYGNRHPMVKRVPKLQVTRPKASPNPTPPAN